MGKSGSGQLTKFTNQILICGILYSISEAFIFSKKHKIDQKRLYDVIKNGAAGSWQFSNRYLTLIKDKFNFIEVVEWGKIINCDLFINSTSVGLKNDESLGLNFENIKEKLGELYEQEPDLDGEILDILEKDKDRLELIDDAQFFIEEAEKNFREIVNGDFEDSKEAAEKYVAADTLIDDLKQSLQLLMPIYSKEVKEISGELQKTKVFQTQVYTALEKPVKDIEDRGYQKITELKSQNTKQPQPKPSA
mgnify:CR=1 FL=1